MRIIILMILVWLLAVMVFSNIPLQEWHALITFYYETEGDNWQNRENWLRMPGTECSWHGVTCNAEETHVIGINLEDNNLLGTPSVIG